MAASGLDFDDVFKNPVHLLALCGCFIPLNTLRIATRMSKTKTFLQLMYTSLIALIHVGNSFRCFAFIVQLAPVFNSNLAITLQFFILHICSSLLFTLGSVVCRYHYRDVYDSFLQYKENYGFRMDLSWLRKVTKMIFGLWVVMVLFYSIGAYGFTIFASVKNKLDVIYPFQGESALGVTIGKVVFGVTTTFVFFSVPGFTMINTLFINIIKSELYCVRDELRKVVTSPEGIDEDAFLLERRRHQQLCHMTHKVSGHARLGASVNIVFSILIIFYVIYTLGSGHLSAGQIGIEVGVLFMNISALVFICIVWGGLPVAASSTLEAFDLVSWSGQSDPLIQQIHLFISQVSTRRIGVDLYGVMTIDSNTIAVVVGALVTYSIVVIDFQKDGSKMECRYNETIPVLPL